MKRCPYCFHENADDATKCANCGHSLVSSGVEFDETRLATEEGMYTFSPGDLIAGRYEVVRELDRGSLLHSPGKWPKQKTLITGQTSIRWE